MCQDISIVMLLVLGSLALVQSPPAAQAAVPAIIPKPVSLEARPGAFVLNPGTHIAVSDASRDVGEKLRAYLRPATGYPFDLSRRGGRNTIEIALDRKLGALGGEGYRLEVKPDHVEIRAFAPAGAFYGVQTLRQLLPAPIFRRSPVGDVPWSVPCVSIEDKPRFGWRGAMIDSSRHFMPKDGILKFLDTMALHKLNSFHWHLTDDDGWRIEIKRFPRLTTVGAFRPEDRPDYDPPTPKVGVRGGFYTQDDVREVVAYAKERFINVVPEIEMPGHSSAIIAAYPELGVPGSNVLNAEPTTIQAMQEILDEVMALFPSTFIHCGGDEVDKGPWHNDPRTQARMKELGIANEDALQSWFMQQMDRYLTSKGRRLVGWDEILEGGLAPGATVMSWRGIDGGIAAAKAGHDVVMAPTSNTYFDYYQGDPKTEPLAIGGFVPLEKVYAYEPVPAALTADEAKHVLGTQAQLWAEYIPNIHHLEYMAWPRFCALSEVAWSPKESKSYDDFLSRLGPDLQRLRAMDVNYRDPFRTPPSVAGSWRKGDVGHAWTSKDWDVTPLVTAAGNYEARFAFTRGRSRLAIAWVELRNGDQVIARDEHPGSAGAMNVNSVYRLAVPATAPGAHYTLRASVQVDGRSDESNGDVFFAKAGTDSGTGSEMGAGS